MQMLGAQDARLVHNLGALGAQLPARSVHNPALGAQDSRLVRNLRRAQRAKRPAFDQGFLEPAIFVFTICKRQHTKTNDCSSF